MRTTESLFPKKIDSSVPYREVLKRRRIDLKENGREMAKQLKRGLEPLFSQTSDDRLPYGSFSLDYHSNLY